MGADPSAKHLAPSRLPKRRQQVAAVCYRIRRRGIEFLLVQTRGGRWIFPKGGVQSGLTHAQSAALEALEEAGVHGRMEELPFARYFRRQSDAATAKKNKRPSDSRFSQPELAVAAHLCEVSRLEPPQESDRNPTWFSVEKAKQRLLEDREPEFGAELARVVDRAAARIQRLHSAAQHIPNRVHVDGMHKVRFEAHEDGRLHDDVRRAVLARYLLRPATVHSPAIEAAIEAHFRKVPQIDALVTNNEARRPRLRLGTGAGSSPQSAHNLTPIDSGRTANLLKAGQLASKRRVPARVGGGRTEKNSRPAPEPQPDVISTQWREDLAGVTKPKSHGGTLLSHA